MMTATFATLHIGVLMLLSRAAVRLGWLVFIEVASVAEV